MILNEGKPLDPVLNMYSDERRQVFQMFIDPVSSWVCLAFARFTPIKVLEILILTATLKSRVRIQTGDENDWFFECLRDTSSIAYARYLDTLNNMWPTHIREMASSL